LSGHECRFASQGVSSSEPLRLRLLAAQWVIAPVGGADQIQLPGMGTTHVLRDFHWCMVCLADLQSPQGSTVAYDPLGGDGVLTKAKWLQQWLTHLLTGPSTHPHQGFHPPCRHTCPCGKTVSASFSCRTCLHSDCIVGGGGMGVDECWLMRADE
jgi:hypothetical protein